MAATRVTPVLASHADARARPAHQSASCASASSPSGLTPGPGGERVADQHVQALHPVRHAAGAAPRSRRHVRERPAPRQVGLVRARGSRRRARGRWPAARSSRASARRTPAGRRPRPPAGRSGSTASGTACRPPAAARSRRRRAGRTGSGARRRRSAARRAARAGARDRALGSVTGGDGGARRGVGSAEPSPPSLRRRACDDGPLVRTLAGSPVGAAIEPAAARTRHRRPSSAGGRAARCRPVPAIATM